MRRAVSSLLAAAALAGGLVLAAPASVSAQECNGMGCAHYNYERTRHSPAYGSRYDGYWDRPGERRHYRHYRYRDYGRGEYYYPGYGYYPGSRYGRGYDRYDHDGYGRGDRAQYCAERFRSYDYRTGTYVGYDGYRHYCG